MTLSNVSSLESYQTTVTIYSRHSQVGEILTCLLYKLVEKFVFFLLKVVLQNLKPNNKPHILNIYTFNVNHHLQYQYSMGCNKSNKNQQNLTFDFQRIFFHRPNDVFQAQLVSTFYQGCIEFFNIMYIPVLIGYAQIIQYMQLTVLPNSYPISIDKP